MYVAESRWFLWALSYMWDELAWKGKEIFILSMGERMNNLRGWGPIGERKNTLGSRDLKYDNFSRSQWEQIIAQKFVPVVESFIPWCQVSQLTCQRELFPSPLLQNMTSLSLTAGSSSVLMARSTLTRMSVKEGWQISHKNLEVCQSWTSPNKLSISTSKGRPTFLTQIENLLEIDLLALHGAGVFLMKYQDFFRDTDIQVA